MTLAILEKLPDWGLATEKPSYLPVRASSDGSETSSEDVPCQRRRFSLAFTIISAIISAIVAAFTVSFIFYIVSPPLVDDYAAFRQTWALTDATLPVATLPDTFKYAEIDASRVCVVQVDDRVLDDYAMPENYADEHFPTAKNLHYWSADNYLNKFWAHRHGYKYMRKSAIKKKGYFDSWPKLAAIRSALESGLCDYIAYFDADVFVTNPGHNFQTLLKYFGFHDQATMFASYDIPGSSEIPNLPYDNATNAGLWFFRNNPLAFRILDDIANCPETVDGCEKYKNTYFHEQTSFNRFVRPTLKLGEELILAQCNDAHGFYGRGDCHGNIITHQTTGKDKIPERVDQILASQLLFLVRQLDKAKDE